MSDATSTILTLARNLLEDGGDERWKAFRNHLSRFDKAIHSEFKSFLSIVEDYRNQSGSIPTMQALLLETRGEEKLHKLIQEIGTRPVHKTDVGTFIASVRGQETAMLREATFTALREATLQLSPAALGSPRLIMDATTNVIMSMTKVKDLANRERQANSILALGEAGVIRQLDRVTEDERKAKAGEMRFYDIGIEHFRERVRIKPGDFYIVGAFTSHGKSIELRRLAYHLQINCCLNVYFLTFELTDEEVLDAMLLRHANNKVIFPNTPYITSEEFDFKTWNDAQRTFYYDVVVPDYYHNPKYGVIKFNYPGKQKYTMEDLRSDMMDTERNEIPLDAVVVDYLQKMWPLPPDARSQPQTADYNMQFSNGKQFGLNYHTALGEKNPIPFLTAAQISRAGLDECMKNDGRYEEKAFSHYSEIERSADTLMTVLMTPEMRDQGQCRHQQIKGRKTGVQTEPIDMRLDISRGEQLSSLTAFSTEQLNDAISRLF